MSPRYKGKPSTAARSPARRSAASSRQSRQTSTGNGSTTAAPSTRSPQPSTKSHTKQPRSSPSRPRRSPTRVGGQIRSETCGTSDPGDRAALPRRRQGTAPRTAHAHRDQPPPSRPWPTCSTSTSTHPLADQPSTSRRVIHQIPLQTQPYEAKQARRSTTPETLTRTFGTLGRDHWPLGTSYSQPSLRHRCYSRKGSGSGQPQVRNSYIAGRREADESAPDGAAALAFAPARRAGRNRRSGGDAGSAGGPDGGGRWVRAR